MRDRFAKDPEDYLEYVKAVERELSGLFKVYIKGSPEMVAVNEVLENILDGCPNIVILETDVLHADGSQSHVGPTGESTRHHQCYSARRLSRWLPSSHARDRVLGSSSATECPTGLGRHHLY